MIVGCCWSFTPPRLWNKTLFGKAVHGFDALKGSNRCCVVLFAAGFLDNVCTDIIHYEDKQLVLYPGNLSEFVKVGRRLLPQQRACGSV